MESQIQENAKLGITAMQLGVNVTSFPKVDILPIWQFVKTGLKSESQLLTDEGGVHLKHVSDVIHGVWQPHFNCDVLSLLKLFASDFV